MKGSGTRTWTFKKRWLLYVAVLGVLFVWRAQPGLRTGLFPPRERQEQGGAGIALAGLDLAPRLIPRLTEEYRAMYPATTFRIEAGGTRHALEALINREVDAAFLSRPLTEEEASIVRAVGDTAMCYPIALGGIAVLASAGTELALDSLSVEDLRVIVAGRAPSGAIPVPEGRIHLYAPDPNLGLWTALVGQIDVPDTAESSIYWYENDTEVARAVSEDPWGLGFASTLALPEGLVDLGVRMIPVRGTSVRDAEVADEGSVATGDYPLFHYLYIASRPGTSPGVSGFVTFLFSGRGQRLIAREGFLPARNAPREVVLSSRPIRRSS